MCGGRWGGEGVLGALRKEFPTPTKDVKEHACRLGVLFEEKYWEEDSRPLGMESSEECPGSPREHSSWG